MDCWIDQDQFVALPTHRQVDLALKLAQHCDVIWEREDERVALLDHLKQIIEAQIAGSRDQKVFHRIRHLLVPWPNCSRRQLVDLMVPLERYRQHNTTDADILKVRNQDLTAAPTSARMPLTLILDHVRSAFNVGAIFRSAECLGVELIYLCGYSPNPDDPKVGRAALGSEENVPWTCRATTEDALREIRKKGVAIFALETCDRAANLFSYAVPKPAAIIIGNERFGISPQILRQADEILQIPTFGQKNSLNIAACFTTVGYELRKQWNLLT